MFRNTKSYQWLLFLFFFFLILVYSLRLLRTWNFFTAGRVRYFFIFFSLFSFFCGCAINGHWSQGLVVVIFYVLGYIRFSKCWLVGDLD